MGGKGEGFTGTIIKDTWTITRGKWKQGREVERGGVVGRGGGERQKPVLEQQQKMFKKKPERKQN